MSFRHFALPLLALLLAPLAGFAQSAPVARPASNLGLKLAPVPEALAAHLNDLRLGQGLLIESVRPDSPAAGFGLKKYDVVLAVGATPVKAADELIAKLRGLRPGESDVLRVIRGGRQIALSVATPAEA